MKSLNRPAGALLLAALLALGLAACKRHTPIAQAFPEPIGASTTCAVDGMLLSNHPGPKGQVVYKDGTRAYFCDVRELWEALYDPEQAHRIAQAYVQPMDGRDWGPHPDGWADAHTLRYVLGSRRMGHMGPTMAPFREQAAAHAFMAEQGGRLVAAADLTAEAVAAYAEEVRGTLRGMDMAGGRDATHMHKPGTPPHDHPATGGTQ